MCKNSIWDLINSTINRRDERDVQTAFFFFFFFFIKQSFCLGAWWPEGRSSSSVFQSLPSCSWSACQMAVNGKDGYRGDLSLWWFYQLCFCSVWGRCPAERGKQTLRCAQLSARLSAELYSPGLWRYHTTLRCTESEHFLWPLNRKFSG